MKANQEQISREEIKRYVDNLIEMNGTSYDRRLSLLLYEFFLRATEKFEWSKQEFLEKYNNFVNNVKKIKFGKLNKRTLGQFREKEKAIYLNKKIVTILRKNMEDDCINSKTVDVFLIDVFFHEALHATDLQKENDEKVRDGLYDVSNEDTYQEDTMLNEYANVIAASLIASEQPMYDDNLGINVINNGGYSEINLPGSIMCSALDMSEIEIAKLKDKGREAFDLYLKNKFPDLDTELIVTVFKKNLNVIYNTYQKGDTGNIILGLENIVNGAITIISGRIKLALLEHSNPVEALERAYYNIDKIKKLLEKVDSLYQIDDDKEIYNLDRFTTIEEILSIVRLYKRFVNNKELFTKEEKGEIYNRIIHHTNKEEERVQMEKLIESKLGENYQEEEIDIENIVKKYYIQSNEPMNDNTELIEQVKYAFRKPTVKEMLEKTINKKNRKQALPKPVLMQNKSSKESSLRNRIKYEKTIVHQKKATTEEKNRKRDDKESTRNIE